MKKLIAVTLTLLMLGNPSLASAHHQQSEPSDGTVGSFRNVSPPMVVPDIRLVEDGRRELDLSAFRGKVVLLNLWATWCPPCVRELPALDRLQQRQGDDDFVVVPVLVDRAGMAQAEAFYQQLDIQHLGLYEGTVENVGQSYPIDVFPASFFIDRQGRVVSFLRSLADWDAPEADQLVEHYKQQ